MQNFYNQDGGGFPIVFIIAGVFAIGVVTYIVMTSTAKPAQTIITKAPTKAPTQPPITQAPTTKPPINTTSAVSTKPAPTVPGSRTQAGSTSDFSFDPRALTGSYTLPPVLMAEDAVSEYSAPVITVPPCPVKNQFYSITANSCVCLPQYNLQIIDGVTTCAEPCVYNGKTVGFVDPKTNKCTCYSDRTGSKCQCSISSIPVQTQTDLCMGNTYTCIDDGIRFDTWTKTSSFATCENIYGLINGKDKGTEKEWKDSCNGILIDPTMDGEINCSVNSKLNTASVKVSQKCSKVPPASLVLSQADICNGLGIVCTGNDSTGPNKGWEKQLIAPKCDALYGLATGYVTDTFENWLGICKNVPGVGKQNMNTINKFECIQDTKSGMYTITARSMCELNPPGLLSDTTKCSGLDWVCDMNVGGWKLQPANTSCSSLFGQILGKTTCQETGDCQINWENKCKNLIADPNYINKFTCSVNTTGFATLNVEKMCPIKVPAGLTFTDTDKCKGLGPVCTGSKAAGAVEGWEKGLSTSSCDSLYGMISNKKTDTVDTWLKKCNNLLTDPNYMSSVSCNINEKNNAYVYIEKQCSLNPPPTAPKCTLGSVLMCDPTTKFQWACVPQKINTQKCVMPIGALCATKNNSSTDPNNPMTQLQPICVYCGQDTNPSTGAKVSKYELTCENAPPSFNCVKGSNNLRSSTELYTLPNADQNDEPVSVWLDSGNLPVYPTIDNDVCLSGKLPYNKLIREGYQGADAIPNPDGFISSYEDGVTKKFYPYDARPGAPMRTTYVAPGGDNVCYYTPREIVKDLGGDGIKVCSNRGSYIQDKDVNHPYASGLKSGRCSCNSYSYINGAGQNVTKQYLGKNCQYSDIEQCGKNGSVDINGKCVCLPGFAGSKCQYSSYKHCNNSGTASADSNDNLVCTCTNDKDPSIYCKDCKQYSYIPVSSKDQWGNNLTSYITKRAVGPSCQYRDDTTCNSKGIASSTGTCTGYYYTSNNTGGLAQYVGPKLEYDDNTTCNGYGSATASNTCSSCKGYRDPATKCTKCVSGRGGADCSITNCNNGTVTNNTPNDYPCTCKTGYTSSAPKTNDTSGTCNICQNSYLDPGQNCSKCSAPRQLLTVESNCSKCSNDSLSPNECTVCKAGANYDPSNCSLCKSGYGGTDCSATDATCNKHGKLSSDRNPANYVGKDVCKCDGNWNPATSCVTCSKGWTGDDCQYSRATTCHGHGDPDYWGTCKCDDGWNGDHDHQCQYDQKGCRATTYTRCDKTNYECASSWHSGTCHKWHHVLHKDINLSTGSCDIVWDETDCHCTGINCGCC